MQDKSLLAEVAEVEVMDEDNHVEEEEPIQDQGVTSKEQCWS